MTKDKNDLCAYCGKPLLCNNDEIFNCINPMTGSIIGSYCSKECLMKDNGLKEDDCKNYIVIRDKAKEK
ncbi:MAG: hypothetical protein [Caudoviricetes sp.]|nr:MAG: hypothetical protein [Caudoviricetes sp.]